MLKDTQSAAWRAGFEWADDLSDDKPGVDEAMEALGIDFGTPECEEFMTGAEVCQAEQMGDVFGYDWLDDED